MYLFRKTSNAPVGNVIYIMNKMYNRRTSKYEVYPVKSLFCKPYLPRNKQLLNVGEVTFLKVIIILFLERQSGVLILTYNRQKVNRCNAGCCKDVNGDIIVRGPHCTQDNVVIPWLK